MFRTFWMIVSLVAVSADVSAAVVANINFNDAIWTISTSESGTANNTSTAGMTITAGKSSGSGGARIVATLNGPISTVGFQNLSISFFGSSSSTDLPEWNGNLASSVASSDGFSIIGSGVSINANSTNDISSTIAETEFVNGSTFPTANFSSDFTFDNSVSNSSITSLEFVLQVNSNNEFISLSNIQILGDSTAVPEPSSLAALGLIGGLLTYRTRRRVNLKQ